MSVQQVLHTIRTDGGLVSGLKEDGYTLFKGIPYGEAPSAAGNVEAVWESDIDLSVSWDGSATGYNVLWGFAADKLYHSYQVFDTKVKIGGLVKGQPVYLRVDGFNENGITEGKVVKLLEKLNHQIEQELNERRAAAKTAQA
jgi:hypothetical protein